MSDGFNHIWASNKHIAAVLNHKNKIGYSWGIHGTTSTGPHHHTDLWDHATGHNIALEYLSIATKGGNTLLNTGTTRIIETNNWCAYFHGLIHKLADFFCVGLRERAAKDSKVLAKYKYQTAINSAITNHHPIARHMLLIHIKVGAAMLNKHIPFFKAALIEQKVEPLASGKLAFGMLGINAFLPATQSGTAALIF